MIDRTAIKEALTQRKKNIRRHRRRAQISMQHRDGAEIPRERKLLLEILERCDVIALGTKPKYRHPDVHILLSLPAPLADELIAFGGQFEDDEDTDGGEDDQDCEPDYEAGGEEPYLPTRERATRRVGEMMAQQPKAAPRGSNQYVERVERRPDAPVTLADADIDKHLADQIPVHHWQPTGNGNEVRCAETGETGQWKLLPRDGEGR